MDTANGGSRTIKPFAVNLMAGQRYSEGLKQQVLALVGRADKPPTQVAWELGVPPKTL